MPSRHIWPLYALLLSALTWVFFADVLTLGLDTHDAETFREHERSAGDFAYIFSHAKEQASGRPVAEIGKFLYFMALGNDPAAFHLLSLALHVLCSFLLARVVLQCGAALELSLLGGLLFLCNIAHFQVVHYISALDYALALALGFGALLAYRRYLITAKLAHLSAYYILLFTAVFAHLSMVVILPFSLYLSRQNAERTTTTLRRLAPMALLLGLAFLAQLALASRETSTYNALEHYPDTDPFTLIISWLHVFLWLLSRLLTTAHWLPLPGYTMQTWELYLGGFAVIGVVFCAHRGNLCLAKPVIGWMPVEWCHGESHDGEAFIPSLRWRWACARRGRRAVAALRGPVQGPPAATHFRDLADLGRLGARGNQLDRGRGPEILSHQRRYLARDA